MKEDHSGSPVPTEGQQAATSDVRRIGPFDVCDGIYEHMGDEYKGGVWLYTEPVDVQQALERAEFFKRACHEAQDIAAAAQDAVLKEQNRCLSIFLRALEYGPDMLRKSPEHLDHFVQAIRQQGPSPEPCSTSRRVFHQPKEGTMTETQAKQPRAEQELNISDERILEIALTIEGFEPYDQNNGIGAQSDPDAAVSVEEYAVGVPLLQFARALLAEIARADS